MGEKYDKVKYNSEYNQANYTKITLRMRKEEAANFKNYVKNETDKSVNQFIVDLIRQEMKK